MHERMSASPSNPRRNSSKFVSYAKAQETLCSVCSYSFGFGVTNVFPLPSYSKGMDGSRRETAKTVLPARREEGRVDDRAREVQEARKVGSKNTMSRLADRREKKMRVYCFRFYVNGFDDLDLFLLRGLEGRKRAVRGN